MFDSDGDEAMCNSADANADYALLRGLESIPLPAASPDFDAAVMARLVQREPWWRQLPKLAASLRPAFAAAALTVPLAVGLIALVGRLPDPVSPRAANTPAATAQALPIEQALDRPDLSPATFRRLSREESAVRGRSGQTPSKRHTA